MGERETGWETGREAKENGVTEAYRKRVSGERE